MKSYAILTSDPHTIVVIPPAGAGIYLAPNTLAYGQTPLTTTIKRRVLDDARLVAWDFGLRLRKPHQMYVYPWHNRNILSNAEYDALVAAEAR
jgi:hypothetical protein